MSFGGGGVCFFFFRFKLNKHICFSLYFNLLISQIRFATSLSTTVNEGLKYEPLLLPFKNHFPLSLAFLLLTASTSTLFIVFLLHSQSCDLQFENLI